MNDSADRLRAARQGAGFDSATAAAQRFGWRPPTYMAHENGSRGFGADVATTYAKAFRVAPEWLLLGKATGADSGAAQIVNEIAPLDALVPVYDVAASAGFGSVVESEDVRCNMAFDKSFLSKMTDAKPSDLAIIRVKGHSMEPTLLDDDHVLVDRTKANLSYDGLFVIRFDDALHVKRIGRSAHKGQVLVISDHPAYPDLDMPKDNLDVIGRVLWVGRKV